jgi:hypothetical protein
MIDPHSHTIFPLLVPHKDWLSFPHYTPTPATVASRIPFPIRVTRVLNYVKRNSLTPVPTLPHHPNLTDYLDLSKLLTCRRPLQFLSTLHWSTSTLSTSTESQMKTTLTLVTPILSLFSSAPCFIMSLSIEPSFVFFAAVRSICSIRGTNVHSHTNLGVPGCQKTRRHPAPHFSWEWMLMCGNECLINEVPSHTTEILVKIKIE